MLFRRFLLLLTTLDVRPKGVWDDFHVTDGRIITGTNPQSAKSTAEEIVKVFEKL